MAKEIKTPQEAAEAAFSYNNHFNTLHVTSDLQAFAIKGDAINHALTLENRTVETFERQEEGAATQEDQKLNAKSVISLIEKETTEEGVNKLIEGDERPSVKAAAAKQIAIIKQNALDSQAAAADEALKQRNGANPGGQVIPTDPEMVDHVVTQETLDSNPDLITEGVKVGDTIQYPKIETPAAAATVPAAKAAAAKATAAKKATKPAAKNQPAAKAAKK